MFEIKKAYVTIMVDDLDRSIEFYNGLLGLTEDLRFGDNWAEMVTKGITIGLHPKKHGVPPELAAKMGWGALKAGGQAAQPNSGASHAHNQVSIGFEVQDLRKIGKQLEEKGVQVHYQENEVNSLAFFKDPDGTYLYLTQIR